MPTLDGWDVSSYQGVIDWSQVRVSNPLFLAAKASQFAPDPRFPGNQAGMRTCPSATLAFYHFLTGQSPAAQAALHYSVVGQLEDNELPAVDVEASAPAGIPEYPPEVVVPVLEAIEQKFQRTPLLYMGKYYRQADDPRYRRFPLWLPGYSPNPATVRPYIVHQFTDASQMPGHNGNVDGNHVVDLAALHAAAHATTAPTPEDEDAMIQHTDGHFEWFGVTNGQLVVNWQSGNTHPWPSAPLTDPAHTYVKVNGAVVGHDGNPVVVAQTTQGHVSWYYDEKAHKWVGPAAA